jgi:hypothetical protein
MGERGQNASPVVAGQIGLAQGRPMTPLAVRHAHAKSQAKLRPDGALDSVALDDPSTQVGLEFAHFFEPFPDKRI